MNIENFETTYNAVLGEKKKMIPTGIYEAEISELNVQKSDKGTRLAKMKLKITKVESVDEGQSEENELDPAKLVGREFRATQSIQIKSEKQEFIASRWSLVAKQVMPREDMQKLYENAENMDEYLSDLVSALAAIVAKGKKKVNVKVQRELDGEFYRANFLFDKPEDIK